jgi:hypothetical protein
MISNPIIAVPPLEHEKPIRSLKGMIFANSAWHARHDDLWPPKAGEQGPTEEQRRAIDVYLANFCRPIKSIANEVRCVACNEDLTTPYGKDIKTSFGRVYLKLDRESPTGEARCGGCGYPIRTKHKITYIGTSIPVVTLAFFPMCYHPSATDRMFLVP